VSPGRAALAVVFAGLSSACAVGQTFTRPALVSGSLVFEAPGTAALTLQPSACRSGHEGYFLGADLWSEEADAVVRVVIDPVSGPVVRVTRGGASYVMAGPACEALTALVAPTGWTVNTVREVQGRLVLDCTAPDGERVHGDVRFERCH
jgi:hypothetical protein